MKTLTLKHNNNFVILDNEFASELLDGDQLAYIFLYKRIDKEKVSFVIRRVDIDFTRQTQCGLLHQYKDVWLFETLCPENQQILYDLGLPYNKDHIFTLKNIGKGEYELCQ